MLCMCGYALSKIQKECRDPSQPDRYVCVLSFLTEKLWWWCLVTKEGQQ